MIGEMKFFSLALAFLYVQNSRLGFQWRNQHSIFGDKISITEGFQKNLICLRLP